MIELGGKIAGLLQVGLVFIYTNSKIFCEL